MTHKLSSPEILTELWHAYCTRHHTKHGKMPSKRQFCSHLDWDPSALAKWMTSSVMQKAVNDPKSCLS